MRLLANLKHHSLPEVLGTRVYKRRASRAIILVEDKILLLFTKKYNDFSFPGGGVDEHEDLILGLQRKLEEETGARDIKVVQEFGYVDEVRPHYRPDYDIIHMLSYFYVCEIASVLGWPKMENYEIANGMEVRWVNIHEAIAHNRKVIESQDVSMGLSIERETLILEMIVRELIESSVN